MSDTLTVSEAATVAGVSVRTMRRWAASGQVRTVGSGHGRRVVAASLSKEAATGDTNGQENRSPDVTVSATTDTETANGDNSDMRGQRADLLADLVRELSIRLADQTALTAMWQERARVLGDQLALAAPDPKQEAQPEPEAVRVAPTPSWSRLWPLLAFFTILAVFVAVGLVALLAWLR